MLKKNYNPASKLDTPAAHDGCVVYMDDMCLRINTSNTDFGSMEGVGGLFILVGLPVLIWQGITEQTIDFVSVYFLCIGFLMTVLPALLIRVKPSHLVFNRISGELYFAMSDKNIMRLRWEETTGTYQEMYAPIGRGIVKFRDLYIEGSNNYSENIGSSKKVKISIPMPGHEWPDVHWAYFQHFMKHGPSDLSPPSEDIFLGDFRKTVKLHSINVLFHGPRMLWYQATGKELGLNWFWRIFSLFLLPPYILVCAIIVWPMTITSAFVNSTRRYPIFPDEIAQHITNDPNCWGKPEEDTKA